MNKTTAFRDEINVMLQSNSALIEVRQNQQVNPQFIELRENLIVNLNDILTTVEQITAKITDAISSARQIQQDEINTLSNLVDKFKKKHNSTWTPVSRKKVIKKPTKTNVKVVDGIEIAAIVVSSFTSVCNGGELYYVSSADHFAVKINDHLLHGNIGNIYTDGRSLEKIKDCKYETSCAKGSKCDYYHDPYKFSESKDCRNYITTSWAYSPPSARKQISTTRRFGSRDSLLHDIVGLGAEEVNRFYDQVMHDLLCLIVLKMHSLAK